MRAKICGDTSGNYHPHGDQIVYPTLVRLGQHWAMRSPLVDPQGNFGSTDGDPPAASRYTEARMTGVAMELLSDLEYDTVDYQPNYDDRLMEPTVLPGKFPTCSSTARPASPSAWRATCCRTTCARSATRSCA